MFCLRTFCPYGRYISGRFVPPDVWSAGRFVPTDVLSLRTFCPYGRYISGRFVSGRFVWAPCNYLTKIRDLNNVVQKFLLYRGAFTYFICTVNLFSVYFSLSDTANRKTMKIFRGLLLTQYFFKPCINLCDNPCK
jgi:hypothetical protein